MANRQSYLRKPNIIWIIPDDTNHRMLGYGGGAVLSPHIDSISRNGIVLSQFHCTAPACCPSRYSYFSGHYGGRCPGEDFKKRDREDREPYSIFFNTALDPDKELSIGHALQRAGYRTGHVGKWHIHGSRKDMTSIPRFDPEENPRDPHVGERLKRQQEHLCNIVRRAGFDYASSVIWGNHESLPLKARNHNIEWITWGGLRFIDECSHGDKPFFLSMATTTIHGPNHVESLLADPYLTGGGYMDAHVGCQPSRQSIYRRIGCAEGVKFNSTTAGVLWMDDAVGAVLDKVRRLGIEDNTLIIFSGDHGPSLGGKFSLYERGTHIPFAAQWPGVIPAGLRSGQPAQNIDFVPTLLDAAGAAAPDDMRLDGQSLMPLLTGKRDALPHREELYFEFGYARAVRTERWKYIAWRLPRRLIDRMKRGEVNVPYNHFGRPVNKDLQRPGLVAGTLLRYPCYWDADQLYDLENDPHETRNLAQNPQHHHVLTDMRERLRGYLKTFDRDFPLDRIEEFLQSDRFEKLKQNAMESVRKLKNDWVADMRLIGFDDATETPESEDVFQ